VGVACSCLHTLEHYTFTGDLKTATKFTVSTNVLVFQLACHTTVDVVVQLYTLCSTGSVIPANG